MAYVNGTTHYNLPQTVGTDKRDWADTNEAFAAVDAALYGAVDDVAQAETAISELQTRMSTAEENITDNTADIAGLDTRLTTAEGAITSQQSQITDLRQDTEDMICAFNEPSATSTHAYDIDDYFIYNDVLYKATQVIAIGDTIVPDTNCATTNVTTELLATEDLSGDVEQLQTDVGQLQTDVSNIKDGLKYSKLFEYTPVSGDTVGFVINKLAPYIPASNSFNPDDLSYIIKVGNNVARYTGFYGNGKWGGNYEGTTSMTEFEIYPHSPVTGNYYFSTGGAPVNGSNDPWDVTVGSVAVYKISI